MYVQVLQAKNLLAADINGKSDPYALFFLDGKEIFKSSVEKATLNPIWEQEFKV